MTTRKQIIKQLAACLDSERFTHSLNVEKIAIKLARKHHVSLKDASWAGLLHDYARQFSSEQLLLQARKHGLEIDKIRKFEPKLFHAELSAILAKKYFGIKSKAILSAIRKHTTGSEKMSKLDKIVYLADHIEEYREFSGVGRLRSLAFKNLDQAISCSLDLMLKYLLEQGLPIYLDTIKTRNNFLLK